MLWHGWCQMTPNLEGVREMGETVAELQGQWGSQALADMAQGFRRWKLGAISDRLFAPRPAGQGLA